MSISEKLARERRARLAAERLLEQKKRELYAANTQLSRHARALSDQIVVQRQEAESLKGRTVQVLHDLERVTSQAELAERRLWEAIETIEDGFAVFDGEARLVSANQAYLALFGAGGVRLGDSYFRVLEVLSQGIADLAREDAQDWQHEMTTRLGRDVIEPKVVRLADGRHIRFHDRRGEVGDLVSMAQDITAAMEREAELEEARAKAEAASRAKSAFLANMSHEIRTPMNGVVGMAELLCETALTEEQRLFAETIRSSGEALLVIINDVLDYSKIEAEKMRLYPEPFDLERCLHEVMLLLQPLAREKGLRLVVDFDIFLPTRFIADPGRMRQILTNLIGNAVKFTPAGHVLARVVGLELAGGDYELHVTVEDTGIGIAPDQIEHIFGEFNQVEDQSNRKFEGTGLGLAITRQLVGLMGGAIWVESEVGHGSCFGFRLVLSPAEHTAAGTGPERPVLLKNALIVDEILINRVILQRQLETYGLAVSSCRNATEALAALPVQGPFDVILVDQDMPATDGPDLAAALRMVGDAAPILFLSSEPDSLADRRCDATSVLAKPILRSQLLRVLQDLSYPKSRLPAPAEPSAPEAAAGRPMRVLAAEDNRTNQLVFRKMVADCDMELQFAGNGREAVELWRSFRPDLVFMDISMPEMDGREAARAIRAAEASSGLSRVPIVALTAHAMDADRVSILEAGIDHYLTKPLKKAEIVAKIAAFCPGDARTAVPPAAGTVPA
ncbi:MAG: response regulator [Albidovulum sp.]|uniref:response regulator n=1 Tax=Albidovulum sp. TaxID=1872424 RepID=UPI00265B6464|nr:response regulator [uncultured Defluviimonas sp.]